jgi:hypothetical protein
MFGAMRCGIPAVVARGMREIRIRFVLRRPARVQFQRVKKTLLQLGKVRVAGGRCAPGGGGEVADAVSEIGVAFGGGHGLVSCGLMA